VSYDSYLSSLNPSLWWKLADVVGSVTALDSSGNGHTGSVVGTVTFGSSSAPTVISPATSALFDGTSGLVIISSNVIGVFPTQLSLVCWFRTVGSIAAPVIFDIESPSNGSYVDVAIVSGTVRFECGIGTTTIASSSASVNDGNWHMAVLTLNTSHVMNGYIDGVSVISPTTVVNPSLNMGNPFTRMGSDFFGNFFSGYMCEGAVFNYALSSTQISALYAGSAPAVPSNLLAFT
jgi:hypothetical protein